MSESVKKSPILIESPEVGYTGVTDDSLLIIELGYS